MEAELIDTKQENVLIQTGNCFVTILPDLGGKIASIRIDNRELLQAPLAPYAPRTRTMAFDEGDASGWDECLPSVAGCTVKTVARTVVVPDHGDLWRVEWSKNRDQGSGGEEREFRQTSRRVLLAASCVGADDHSDKIGERLAAESRLHGEQHW